MHMLLAVNAAWNIWSFRRPLAEALTGDGRRISVLAPPDDAVPELGRLGWVAEGVVEYLGTTGHLRSAIAATSRVVLPSYREREARPLIGTDAPGRRAVVDRDVSGFLCEVRSAKSLAATMERFLALAPEAQKAMGAAGRAKMEREFDQALVVDAYRAALDIIATGRRGTR